ncbi:hypothetical protein OS493_034437 [Desmophyllum pertusum]|uniref:Uncharacterized protein n=1 Tax=Desmophyllum pertusum TaxID=174260 RepID=A0A9W9ZIU8_9CNID|nr:hypothetical protein OS493_034437 [Desmophyllum pertusum]
MNRPVDAKQGVLRLTSKERNQFLMGLVSLTSIHFEEISKAASIADQDKIRKSTLAFKRKRANAHRQNCAQTAKKEAQEGKTYESGIGLNLDLNTTVTAGKNESIYVNCGNFNNNKVWSEEETNVYAGVLCNTDDSRSWRLQLENYVLKKQANEELFVKSREELKYIDVFGLKDMTSVSCKASDLNKSEEHDTGGNSNVSSQERSDVKASKKPRLVSCSEETEYVSTLSHIQDASGAKERENPIIWMQEKM